MKRMLVGFAIVVSFVFGGSIFPLYSDAQSRLSYPDPEKVLVRLSGYARSSDRPEESKLFQAHAENDPRNSFTVVPKGKKLIVTDLMFDARHARQDIVINLNQRIEDKQSQSFRKNRPLQQVNLMSGESKDIHLCTGYVVSAGNGLVGHTNAGLEPNQVVQMSFTGYLIDEEASLW